MSITEKDPNADPSSDIEDDCEPTNAITRDPYGRRSRAWRHKTSNKIISATEFTEARTTYLPERNMFRRFDKLTCFMIWVYGGNRNAHVGNLLAILSFPFMSAYMAYIVLMAGWDRRRVGPPPPESE